MFDPYGNPVPVFDSVVSGYLPKILAPGESMTQGITRGAFRDFGGLPLYPTEGGRPFLIVKWKSNVWVNAPKISAAILGYKTDHPLEPGVWSTGPEFNSVVFQDGIVVKQRWGF